MTEKSCRNVIDYFAHHASVTLKNPVLDVLKQLVNDLDLEATYGYLMFDTANEDVGYTTKFPEFEGGLGNFAAIQIDKASAPNGINNHIFLPSGCHIMAPRSKLHDTRGPGAKKIDGFDAQCVTLISFYIFLRENREGYINEMSVALDNDGRATMEKMVDDFFAFFRADFTEACNSRITRA